MSDLRWLPFAQIAKLFTFFPKSRGKPPADDRRVSRGLIFINRNGLRGCDAPKEYSPRKTLYSRWKRWNEKGLIARMMVGLSSELGEEKTVMIKVSGRTPCVRMSLRKHLKARLSTSSTAAKKECSRLIGRAQGGMNTKL